MALGSLGISSRWATFACGRKRREGRFDPNRPHAAHAEACALRVTASEAVFDAELHDARRAQEMARALDERGVYVAGFFFPVVPKGRARIRTQMSAGLTEADIDFAIDAFTDAGKALGVI